MWQLKANQLSCMIKQAGMCMFQLNCKWKIIWYTTKDQEGTKLTLANPFWGWVTNLKTFSRVKQTLLKKKITKGVFGIISSVTKRENSKSSQGIGITWLIWLAALHIQNLVFRMLEIKVCACTGGPSSSSCEIIRACMGIFTTALRNKEISQILNKKQGRASLM